MRYYLLFLFLLQTITSLTQTTEFSTQGKVTKLVVEKNKIVPPDDDALTVIADAEREKFRKLIADKIEETLKRLNDDQDGLKPFCVSMWGLTATETLIEELESTKSALNENSFSGRTLTVLTLMETSLENHLVKQKVNGIYEYKAENDHEGKLLYTNPFNSFIIHYYIEALKKNNELKNMTLKQWQENIQFMDEQLKQVDSLIKVVHANNGEMTVPHFQAIRTLHDELNDPVKRYKKIQDTVSNWFKHWLWIRGGELRLNPLDFTTDHFLEKYPEADLTKADTYDEYIDTAINRFIRYDTSARFEHFRKLLGERKNGKELYKLQTRAEQMEKNKQSLKQQLTISNVLNELKIPEQQENDFGLLKRGWVTLTTDEPGFMRKTFKKERNEDKILVHNKQFFYSYSFALKDKFEANQKKSFLTFPVRAGEIKKLVVHNVPVGNSAILKSSFTSIVDRSAFQQGVDTLLDLATEIMKIAINPSYFDIASVFLNRTDNGVITTEKKFNSNLDKRDNKGVKANIKNLDNYDSKKIPDEVFDLLKKSIDKKDYDDKVFDSFKKKYEVSVKNDAGIVTNFNSKLMIEAYYDELATQKKNYFECIRTDSLSLSFMIDAFNKSSLVPKVLKGEKEEATVYNSKLLTTDPSDDPVKYNIQVVGLKGTDSTHSISKFTYKVGKNYRFQLSAGIAYTFGNFIQSSAKEENGQIIISNSAQSYRLVTGFHVHFGKGLFLQDNRLFGRFSERSSIYVGVGIPKPLENVYLGLGYDLLPGLKLTAGAHIYRNDRYVIQNNSIIEQRLQYNFAGPFAAIQIDPAGLLAALNIISSK